MAKVSIRSQKGSYSSDFTSYIHCSVQTVRRLSTSDLIPSEQSLKHYPANTSMCAALPGLNHFIKWDRNMLVKSTDEPF